MAQGGGRGWFHRRRTQPQPQPEATSSTTQASSPVDQDPGPTVHAGSVDERPLPSPAFPADGQLPVQSASTVAQRPPDSVPLVAEGSPAAMNAPSTQSTPPAPLPDAGHRVPAPDTGPPDQEAVVSDPPPQGDEHTTRGFSRIDWDAETAAALTGEVEPLRSLHTTPPPPDALLEDLIREIVGDSAAERPSDARADVPRDPAESTDEPAAAATSPGQEPTSLAGPTPVAPPVVVETTPVPTTAVEPHGTTGAAIGDPPASQRPLLDVVESDSRQSSSTLTVAAAAADVPVRPMSEVAVEDTPTRSPSSATSLDLATGAQSQAVSRETHPEDDVDTTTDLTTPLDDRTRPLMRDVSRETVPGDTVHPAASQQHRVDNETRQLTPSVSRETSADFGGTPLADELADETRRRIALDETPLPLPPETRILTISNQKGGVGKTTTAVNLAAALARTGARVLVIDLDPQGNASTALGVDHRSDQQSVYEVLVSDLPLAEVIRPSTEHRALDCVPATIHLAGAEIELVSLVAREQRLRRALNAHLASMQDPYHYVLIDCPPSLGLLTINAFVAAREVLIPIQCEYYALEGLSQLLSNIELIEKHLNADLRLSTILLTMYDSRTNLAQQVAQEVRNHFPAQTLETIIPRSVRVSEAPSYGQSVITYDYASSGSLSYREAAAEIARRGAA